MPKVSPLLLQFRPSLRARGITSVTPEFLAARGLRALILDLDNTLVAWHGHEVQPHVRDWVRTMDEAGIRLCIVSNTHRPRRLAELAGLLGVAFVPSGGKPRRGGFLKAIAAMEVSAAETAVVGDQVMTDIWGGNRCGLLTILVEPLSHVEFVGTRLISRNVERAILHLLHRAGHPTDPLDAEVIGRE